MTKDELWVCSSYALLKKYENAQKELRSLLLPIAQEIWQLKVIITIIFLYSSSLKTGVGATFTSSQIESSDWFKQQLTDKNVQNDDAQ